jgi:hypothetical protein
MPKASAPRLDAYETVVEGRFCFHVAIAHPLVGPVVAYRGFLALRQGSAADAPI